MAQAETNSKSDLVLRAGEIRPLLARNAARAERDRRLPAENIEALEAANLFKAMTPRRWGGWGAPLSTVLSAHAELAKGCASSAWVTMIIGGSMWVASLLPDRGRRDLRQSGQPAQLAA